MFSKVFYFTKTQQRPNSSFDYVYFINTYMHIFLWRRERLPTPVFCPGEFHGLYSPWGHEESDTTGRLSLHMHIFTDFIFFVPISTENFWLLNWTELTTTKILPFPLAFLCFPTVIFAGTLTLNVDVIIRSLALSVGWFQSWNLPMSHSQVIGKLK